MVRKSRQRLDAKLSAHPVLVDAQRPYSRYGCNLKYFALAKQDFFKRV